MNYESIILSGLPVSGKSTLATMLSEHYDWPIHAIGELFRAAWTRQHPHEQVSFEEYWRTISLEENRKVNVEAKKRFAAGQVIGDSRYASYCKDLPALLVFITAPLEIRAARACHKYPGKSKREIEQILLEREQVETRTGQELFDCDYRDPQNYHVVLDSEKLQLHQEFTLIKALMES